MSYKKLHNYLNDNGIMQTWFADKIGITDSRLWMLLNGKCHPSIKNAYLIEIATNGFVKIYDWLNEEMLEQAEVVLKKTPQNWRKKKKRKNPGDLGEKNIE